MSSNEAGERKRTNTASTETLLDNTNISASYQASSLNRDQETDNIASIFEGVYFEHSKFSYTENEEPHPQVVVALGLVIVNREPCKPSS